MLILGRKILGDFLFSRCPSDGTQRRRNLSICLVILEPIAAGRPSDVYKLKRMYFLMKCTLFFEIEPRKDIIFKLDYISNCTSHSILFW